MVEILGEVDVKVKSVRGQVEYTALVVAGGQGILVLLEKDSRKLGIHVVGLLAGFLDGQAAIVDNREWVEENTADMREEVQASVMDQGSCPTLLSSLLHPSSPSFSHNTKIPQITNPIIPKSHNPEIP